MFFLNLMPLTSWIATVILGLLVLAFLLFGAKDLFMLFRKPVKGMGTGVSRISAVARTTVIESWVARVWMLPVIWLIVSVLLILVVRPYDESDRFPLYIRIVVTAQEWMLLIMMWVLACVSLPRERERKIIITNASKPLSRLEIMLGKICGFATMSFLLLAIMGVISWAVLHVCDYELRREAAKAYQLAEDDYRQHAGTKEAVLPPEDKRRLAQEGSIFANNYITVPPENMSIVGGFDETTGERYLKGGSMEKVIYHFTPRVFAPTVALVSPVGSPVRPFFEFRYTIIPYLPDPPRRIQLEVTAQRVGPHISFSESGMKNQTVWLDSTGHGVWWVENPTDLFTRQDDPDKEPESGTDLGPVEVTVTCSTPGVHLLIKEGGSLNRADFDPSNWNVLAGTAFYGTPVYEPPEHHPLMRGFERRDMQEISGPDKRELREYGASPVEAALFRFPAKNLENIPIDKDGNFTISIAADIDKADNQSVQTEGKIQAYNDAARGQKVVTPKFTVIEKRVTEVKLPQSLLGDKDVKKRGDLVVVLTCQTQGHWICLKENSLRIDLPPSMFVFNILKTEVIIFCEVFLLIVMSVVCSVRLGWPVAMLTSGTCLIFGYIAEFLVGLVGTGLSSLGYNHYGQMSAGEKFFDTSFGVVWHVLNFIRSLLPDYTRYDTMEYITSLRNTPISVIGHDLLWTLIYALPFIALGYLLFRKQEIG